MSRRNTLRTLIASFLLMLATGTLMVKSVHCVLVPHDYQSIALVNGQTTISTDKTDSCPICSFDFFPVILHSLKVLPDVTPFAYAQHERRRKIWYWPQSVIRVPVKIKLGDSVCAAAGGAACIPFDRF